MARIYAPGDIYYKGHEGGFPAESIVEVARQLEQLPGIKFSGITTFPTQLFDAASVTVKHTHNYETLLEAKKTLEKAGYTNIKSLQRSRQWFMFQKYVIFMRIVATAMAEACILILYFQIIQ